MPPKRRRSVSTTEPTTRIKRTKFVLELPKLSETVPSGVVLVTGAGDVGQLGLGPDVLEKSRAALVDIDHKVIDICAGGMHTVCLTDTGKVLTFGCNDEGALGRVTEGKEDAEFEAGEVDLPGKVLQISAGDSHSAALLDDGRVFAWGTFRDSHGNMGMTLRGNERLPFEIIKGKQIIKIASGADHIAFLTISGEVLTCGCAEQGQLGRTSERTSSRHARSSGRNEQIAKLLEPSKISLKPSLKIHFENIWTATYGTFCKVAGCNDIFVFGLNNYSQLGIKNMVPQFQPIISNEFSKHSWITISSGQHHTIALDDKGKVYAIGRKEYGRLGLGKGCEDAVELQLVEELKSKECVNVACGSSTSFAVSKEGELYGWGMGTNGQLGTGQEEDCEIPTLIKSKQLQERKVIKVSSGGQHTVILAVTNLID